MATHVQSTGVQSSGAVASQGKAFASNVTAGNAIVCQIAWFKNSAGAVAISTVADGIGNSLAAFPSAQRTSTADTHAACDIWYKVNIAGGASTITVTPNASSFTSFTITEASGLATSSAEDTRSSAEGSSAAPACGAFTTASAGITFGVVTHTGADTAITENTGGGYSLAFEAESTTNQPINGEYKVTAAGSQNPSWTLGASRAWICTGAGFKDAAGAASPVLQDLMHRPGFMPLLCM